MRGYSGWSFRQYAPMDEPFRLKAPYICAIRPGDYSVEAETIRAETLTCRLRGNEKWQEVPVCNGKAEISGLEKGSEYELCAKNRDVSGSIRLVKTGAPPGVVVNYLHSEDTEYSFSGRYLCSPSIVRLKDGSLIASMDLYGVNTPQNLSMLFKSFDDGASWNYLCDLFPCFWGRLFIHKDILYMLAMSKIYGDVLLGSSSDGGETWGTPTVLFRGSCDLYEKGFQHAPMPMYSSHGRLWTCVEYGSWERKHFAVGVLSADENADITKASNWTCGEFLHNDPKWPGADEFSQPLEGNVVTAPDGRLLTIWRYSIGKAMIAELDPDNPEGQLKFIKMTDFPVAHSKFEIFNHGGYYYVLGNRPPLRNILSLFRSKDLETWEFEQDILNCEYLDKNYTAFQYPCALCEGDTLTVLSRTAWNGAHSFHDSNFSTMHRIKL